LEKSENVSKTKTTKTYLAMSWAQASERARWAEMALMLVVFTVAAGERAVKVPI